LKTPRQIAAEKAVAEAGGNKSEAARRMGVDRTAVRDLLRRARKNDEAVEAAMRHVGTEIVPNGMWVKTKPEGDTPGYSVYLRPQDDQVSIAERMREVFETITPAPAAPAPPYTGADLATLYLLADAHLGLMAWGKETGEDWDLAKGDKRLRDWIGQCIAASPASRVGVILSIGDTTHANDYSNQTPRSKHVLDVDTRHYKTIDVAVKALVYATDMALERHQHVVVAILPGNHDPEAYIALRMGLYYRYINDERVTVHNDPGEFWVYQHGRCMVATHHGHKAKPDKMVMMLADDYADIWGNTRFRFLFTGHFHHYKASDIGGVQWEQLRAMSARDANAVSNAYVGRAQLQAVTLHKERGEVHRVKVNV
jgi:hypothetical protein